MNEVNIRTKPVTDADDMVFFKNILASASGTKLLLDSTDANSTFFRTRTGRKARLAFVGNAVGSGGDPYVTFHILVNGNRINKKPYDSFNQALGETFNGWANISAPVNLPENALVEVTADNSDSGNAYDAFCRVRVEYEDLN